MAAHFLSSRARKPSLPPPPSLNQPFSLNTIFVASSIGTVPSLRPSPPAPTPSPFALHLRSAKQLRHRRSTYHLLPAAFTSKPTLFRFSPAPLHQILRLLPLYFRQPPRFASRESSGEYLKEASRWRLRHRDRSTRCSGSARVHHRRWSRSRSSSRRWTRLRSRSRDWTDHGRSSGHQRGRERFDRREERCRA